LARTAEEARAQAEAAARAQVAGAEQNAVVTGEETFTAFAKALGQASPTIRAKIAQQLKDAGIYRGKVTGEFNNRFYDALIEAEKRRTQLATVMDVPNRFEFIASLASEGKSVDGAGGPSKTISTVEDVNLRAMAIAVLEAQTGDQGTEAEINNLIERVKKKQAKNPRITTYTTSGGVTKSSTTGGVDAGQLMIDIVSKTDEARANKVLQAYNIAVNTLGGLR